jgi:hypothetical protein
MKDPFQVSPLLSEDFPGEGDFRVIVTKRIRRYVAKQNEESVLSGKSEAGGET